MHWSTAAVTVHSTQHPIQEGSDTTPRAGFETRTRVFSAISHPSWEWVRTIKRKKVSVCAYGGHQFG
jgi:hypothetical protein